MENIQKQAYNFVFPPQCSLSCHGFHYHSVLGHHYRRENEKIENYTHLTVLLRFHENPVGRFQ